MKPELSIIIPCYNCSDTLKESVSSCFVQGLDNFEIVMVDDGSTDNTKEIMQKLADEHKEIRLFYHNKNKGGGATRNTAVEKSEGEIIFCLDSDDLLPQGSLLKMLAFIKEKKCDGATIHRSIKFNGKDINDINHVDVSPFIDKRISLSALLSKDVSFIPAYVNFMYTKSAFNKMGGYPISHGYDTQGFAWRFLCAGLSVYVCPNAEYLHRVNFKESYFLREYNNGKMNYNWRDIFLEHYYIFNKETLDFICRFDCSDFTRNLLEEIKDRPNVLKINYEETFGMVHKPLNINLPKNIYIPRNSLKGFYLRIKYRLKKKVVLSIQKINKIVAKIYRYSYSSIIFLFVRCVNKKDFVKAYFEMRKKYLDNKDGYDFSDFVSPEWYKIMLGIEEFFINNFTFSFLRHSLIKRTMFMYTFDKWKNLQKNLISEYFSKEKAKDILREYNIGKPLLNDAEYITSGNNIHHLYHFVKFFKETKTNEKDFDTIIEVGGGYGNMAKIYKALNNKVTYTIIDLPVFSYIQAIYLSVIFGAKSINIVDGEQACIKDGLINLVPLNKNILGKLNTLVGSVDLFISTWALSESNEAMQNYIKDVNYFDAKYLLLAYQESSSDFHFAEDVQNITERYTKVFDEETEYIENNYYLFCKRN